jgi:hypothetical protein
MIMMLKTKKLRKTRNKMSPLMNMAGKQSLQLIYKMTHLKSQLKLYREGRVFNWTKIIPINQIKEKFIKKNLINSQSHNSIKRK